MSKWLPHTTYSFFKGINKYYSFLTLTESTRFYLYSYHEHLHVVTYNVFECPGSHIHNHSHHNVCNSPTRGASFLSVRTNIECKWIQFPSQNIYIEGMDLKIKTLLNAAYKKFTSRTMHINWKWRARKRYSRQRETPNRQE